LRLQGYGGAPFYKRKSLREVRVKGGVRLDMIVSIEAPEGASFQQCFRWQAKRLSFDAFLLHDPRLPYPLRLALRG